MDDSSPPSHQRIQTKSALSRLSKLRHYSKEAQQLSLEIVPSSAPKISTPSPASTVSPKPPYTLPLQELLMLSPSPLKKSKARLADRLDDDAAAVEASGVRKRCKTRNSASGCAAASPRGSRRSRRRLEQDVRDGRELATVGAGAEVLVKPRKKRNGDRSRTGKSIPTPPVPSPRSSGGDGCNLDTTAEAINDLIMWKDVSKSSLWFGIFSFLSQVGLVFLGLSFFSNTMRQREAKDNNNEAANQFKLTEEDILRVGRLMLPAVNLAISKTREIFSGEPAMTLKVIPIFVLGAEYGHLITLWRLCALGFFLSFTGPKLYSTYSSQLSKKVEYVKSRAKDAWESCTHKKIVVGSAVTAFWNLTSIRTRIFAAFLCLVIVRYHRQGLVSSTAEGDDDTAAEIKQREDKALVAIE